MNQLHKLHMKNVNNLVTINRSVKVSKKQIDLTKEAEITFLVRAI